MVPFCSHLAERGRRIVNASALTISLIALLVGPGGQSAYAQDTNLLLDRWFAAQANLQSWSADLIQTRCLKVLAQPLVSTGKVWVQMPDRFRWELGQPPQTVALRQPGQLLIVYPRLKRAEKYSLTNLPPGPWRDALALVDASFPRSRAASEALFRLHSVTATNASAQVALQPKSPSARKFIAELLVTFCTNDLSLASTELRFADGSSLRNDFTNTVRNLSLDAGLFDWKLPPDFTVVEPLRP